MADQRRDSMSSHQQGLSAIGVLLAVAALVAVVTLLLRLGPHYLDWKTMQSIIGDLPAADVHRMRVEEVRESLGKRFKVNSLRDFDLKKIILLERTKEGTTLTIDYEKRENIIGNVDVVLTFHEQYRYQ